MRAFILAAAVLPIAALAQEPPAVPLPSWMSGCWQQLDGERWTEECWTVPRHGQMLGSGRSGKGDTRGSFEFMRIDREGEALILHAAPRGREWTSFTGGFDSQGGVTFVNAAHDFPQRVRYWRDGERLIAEVSLADGAKARRWSFERMGG